MSKEVTKVTQKIETSHLGPMGDFRNFLYVIWQHIGQIGKPPTTIQYDVADYLQNGPEFSIIMGFRGMGKSYITAAYCLWVWLCDPEAMITVVSASEPKAKDFAHLVRSLIKTVPMLNYMEPQKDQRDNALSFDIGPASRSRKDPSMTCKGITSQLTGGRATLIIADDIETSTNSATLVQKEALLHQVKEFEAMLTTRNYGIRYLGTPHTQDSIYYELEKTGYALRVWCARYPESPEVYRGRLAPKIADVAYKDPASHGKTTDPERFTDDDLIGRELRQGKSYFKLQYMLDPSLSDSEKYPLKAHDLIIADVDDEIAPIKFCHSYGKDYAIVDRTLPRYIFSNDTYQRPSYTSEERQSYVTKLMAIDPAGGNDETAYCILFYLNGYIFAKEIGGFIGNSEENLKKLAYIAYRYKVHKVVVEKNFGNGMFTQILSPVIRKIHNCAIEEVNSKGQKERRICDTLEPVFNAHRLVFDEQIIRADENEKVPLENKTMYQISRITRDRQCLPKDDRVDVLAIGVSQFTEKLRLDPNKSEEELEEIKRRKEMQNQINELVYGTSNTPNRSMLNYFGATNRTI